MTEKENNILNELKNEIEGTKKLIKERDEIQDFAGALRYQGELRGLLRAHSIISGFID